MELMQESSTDKRLDDLNDKVDRGFDRIDAEARALRVEMRTEFTAVREEMRTEFASVREEMRAEFAAVRGEMSAEFTALRGEMKAGFERVDERFESLHRLMIQLGGLMLAALIGLIATQL